MKKVFINIIFTLIGLCIIIISINVNKLIDNEVIDIVCSCFMIALALMVFGCEKIYLPNPDGFDKRKYLIKVLIYSSIMMALIISTLILIVVY